MGMTRHQVQKRLTKIISINFQKSRKSITVHEKQIYLDLAFMAKIIKYMEKSSSHVGEDVEIELDNAKDD